MSSFNQVILVGRLGQDPELSYTTGGSAVCKLSLATSEVYTDKQGNKKESTDWHRVLVWNSQAENVAKYLVKGSQILVQGKLKTRSFEKDGRTQYVREVVALRVNFLSPSRATSSSYSEHAVDVDMPEGEDIPF